MLLWRLYYFFIRHQIVDTTLQRKLNTKATTVMSVTSDGDRFKMWVTDSLYWRRFQFVSF